MRKIRYAVVGLGHISQAAVLPAFKNASKNSELVAWVTGSPVKASKLSKIYRGVKSYSYEDYDKLLDSGLVDAVYIALPNDMHFDFSLRALQKGVHVLCEKPFTLNEKEA